MAPRQKMSSTNLHPLPYSSPKLRPLFAVVVNETTIVQHKLRIPKKCVMLFGEELGEMGTLTVPHGNGNRAWKVRMVKNGKNKKNNIWLKDGMEEFINYYSIHLHSILLLTYQGNSMFSVRICDALGSEIDYPFDEDDDSEDDDDDDDDDDDEDVCGSSKRKGYNSQKQPRKSFRRSVDSKSNHHNSKHFQTSNNGKSFIKKENEDEEEEKINSNKKRKFHLKQEVNDENEMIFPRSFTYCNVRQAMSKETKKAIQAACASKLHNPSFLAVVKRIVEVPAEFVRKHMKFCPERIQLQVSNNQKKKWDIKCYYKSKDYTLVKRLGKGWGSFSSSQKLNEGDVCVFELIRKINGVILRVWIYRV
ncbi:hypothetical protein CsatA_009100 [Cannabis sativa]